MRSERTGDEVQLPKLGLSRVHEAERLYRDCKETKKSCLLLASGGDPADHGISEAALIKKELLKNGVPEADILTEEKSVSTFHNAKYTADILRKETPELTVLVTSDAHVPRALKMFKLFGVIPLPAPTDLKPTD